MKLKFKNFRCYTEKEFDFGEGGLILLSGPSGVGKSTIFHGIDFALYGKGKKPQTFGQRSCKVELEIDNLKIVRQRCPNLLIVIDTLTDEEYQDEAGQGIIDERFGTNFNITSYIQQNAEKSFFLMNPTDKITFLEQFAFQGVELDKIKGRCNAEIKKANTRLTQVSSQLAILNENFQTTVKPQKVPFPLKGANKEKAIKNETVRLENAKTRIKKAERSIEKFVEKLTEAKIAESEAKNRETRLVNLQEKITSLEKEKSDISYEGDEMLKKYEENLNQILKHKELITVKKRYIQEKTRLEQLEKAEKEQIQTELTRISSQLWKGPSHEEAKQTKEDYEKLVDDLRIIEKQKLYISKFVVNRAKVEEEEKRLVKNRELLGELQEKLPKLRLQDELYECPACTTRLRFQDNALHLFEEELPEADETADDVARKIATLVKTNTKLEQFLVEEREKMRKIGEAKKEISEIESRYEELLPLKEAESVFEETENYLSSNLDLEKNKKKLESLKGFSPPLISLRKQLVELEQRISGSEKILVGGESEEEVRNAISQQKNRKSLLVQLEKQLVKCKSEFEELRGENETVGESVAELAKNLSDQKDSLQKYRTDLELHQANLGAVEKYREYIEKITEYKKRAKQITELRDDEQDAKKELSAVSILKEKLLQAENLAISNFIESINVHAQGYLDLFFPDDPISVRLLPFKETKKSVKPQISTFIDYKGMEASPDMLSGGELARVVLAFTLALAELFNAPLLMLDECTASLDQEATSVVMEGLRANFSNRLTVVIAHQVVSGNFDRQIAL